MKTLLILLLGVVSTESFHLQNNQPRRRWTERRAFSETSSKDFLPSSDRRGFLATTAAVLSSAVVFRPREVQAIGPVKISLSNPVYTATDCPKDRPIPGQMAMKGMRGMLVTVDVNMDEQTPKDLEKVGIYGFVTDPASGASVLANNPDGGTDAGQFAMIEAISTKDKKLRFDFIAALPKDKDLTVFENGIGPLDFSSLRLISFPGGQQYGAINPCEMNEFSDECADWEEANGPYKKADYMMKSNERTKGR